MRATPPRAGDGYLFPGQCVELGFRRRLELRALSPLALIAIIALLSILRSFLMNCAARFGLCGVGGGHNKGWFKAALFVSLPFSLFIAFCLAPGVSKGIFKSWDCEAFDLDGEGHTRSFLREDLTITCNDRGKQTAEHDELTDIAYLFVFIWPVLMPFLFVLVLLPSREALRLRRKTRMVRATEFLHKEYSPLFFWWEVLPLFQRLALTGWVLFIPVEEDTLRMFVGLLVAVGYLTLLQFVQPCTLGAAGARTAGM